jgi:peptidoglycan/xylan/chitin deacetylase (PgdA/CDA1 family)
MKQAIKQVIKQLWANPLVWRHLAIHVRSPGLIVLMYHRINGHRNEEFDGLSQDIFCQQMQWIREHCRVVSPDEAKVELSSKRQSAPAVLVTLDDGYRCVYENVYPILKELTIPALVFLPTQVIDDGGLIWTDAVVWAARRSPKDTVSFAWLNPQQWNLVEVSSRYQLASACKSYLKNIADIQRRKLLGEYCDALGVSHTIKAVERQMLTWDEVRETLPLITYGGHTHSHPIMSQVTAEELEREIRICKERITAETGQSPRYFAYPNGCQEDFNVLCECLLQKHGFELAYSTIEGINNADINRMQLRRIPTHVSTTADLAWLISTV